MDSFLFSSFLPCMLLTVPRSSSSLFVLAAGVVVLGKLTLLGLDTSSAGIVAVQDSRGSVERNVALGETRLVADVGEGERRERQPSGSSFQVRAVLVCLRLPSFLALGAAGLLIVPAHARRVGRWRSEVRRSVRVGHRGFTSRRRCGYYNRTSAPKLITHSHPYMGAFLAIIKVCLSLSLFPSCSIPRPSFLLLRLRRLESYLFLRQPFTAPLVAPNHLSRVLGRRPTLSASPLTSSRPPLHSSNVLRPQTLYSNPQDFASVSYASDRCLVARTDFSPRLFIALIAALVFRLVLSSVFCGESMLTRVSRCSVYDNSTELAQSSPASGWTVSRVHSRPRAAALRHSHSSHIVPIDCVLSLPTSSRLTSSQG